MNIDNEREKFEEKLKTVLNKITGCEKYTYALNSIMTAFDTSRAKQSEAEIAELKAQVEALSKDAERYQLCRKIAFKGGYMFDMNIPKEMTEVEFDNVLDEFKILFDADQAKDNQ